MIFLEPPSQSVNPFSCMFTVSYLSNSSHHSSASNFIGFLIWLPKPLITWQLLMFSSSHAITSTPSLSSNLCFCHAKPLWFPWHALLFHATQSLHMQASQTSLHVTTLTSQRTEKWYKCRSMEVYPFKEETGTSLTFPNPIIVTHSFFCNLYTSSALVLVSVRTMQGYTVNR